MTIAPVQIPRLPDHLIQHGSDPDLLRAELMEQIVRAIEHHPRTLQKAIGPSEVGHPCARRVGYTMLDHPECNPNREPAWKPTVGTAVHAWLEDVFTQANTTQAVRNEGATRWIVEGKVSVGDLVGTDLNGHSDLFDRVTGTVVDWKCVGPTQLKKYKAHGPGDQYRYQAHLYGRGWAQRGQDVQRVAVMFLPRNGELREHVWWSEPYDEAVAIEALTRASGIKIATTALGTAVLPQLATANAWCQLCPFFRAGSTDLVTGCPGDENAVPSRSQDQILTLI